MLITNSGIIIRIGAGTISQTGRSTLGVRLMRLAEGVLVSSMAKVDPEEEEEVLSELNTDTEISPEVADEVEIEVEDAEIINELDNETED